MEIHIDIKTEGSRTVVRVAGSLSGDAIVQLREACDRIEGAFVLDLSNLRFADAAGTGVIRKLGEKGANVRGASPFVQLLLDEEPEEEIEDKHDLRSHKKKGPRRSHTRSSGESRGHGVRESDRSGK